MSLKNQVGSSVDIDGNKRFVRRIRDTLQKNKMKTAAYLKDSSETCRENFNFNLIKYRVITREN